MRANSLESECCFDDCTAELATVADIRRWEVLVFLVDVFDLHHDVRRDEPADRANDAVDRDVHETCRKRSLDRVVACADPEVLRCTEAIEQVSCELSCFALRDFG